MLIATRSFTAADGPKPSRRERRFWAETESLRHPREAADPIHDLSALDAEAERAALAEVDEGWGAAAPWQNWRAAFRGALQWAQMGRKRRFRPLRGSGQSPDAGFRKGIGAG